MTYVKGTNRSASALDVIFTCDICQTSISDIYSNAAQTDFHDGRAHTSDRRVTCLWLTSCMHLTCGRHLEGGGAPFHPKGEPPRAICPFCLKESNDRRPKALYAVRGLQPGNYDSQIPGPLFEAPPVKLQDQGIRMEALKFQYLSLIRYGTSMFSKNQLLEQAARKVDTTAKRVQAENRTLTEENRELRARLASLEDAQADVAKWRERMPKLTHYLKQWPLAMEEVNELRGQLNQLGYAVPKRDYAYQDRADRKAQQSTITDAPGLEANGSHHRTARVPTDNTPTEYATGRAGIPTSNHHRPLPANEVAPQAQSHISESSSGRKRKLSEYTGPGNAPNNDGRLQDPIGGDRFPEHREIPYDAAELPRSELPDASVSVGLPSDPRNVQQAQTFERGKWQKNRGPAADLSMHATPQPRTQACDTETYFMTGAGSQSAQRTRQIRQDMASHPKMALGHGLHQDGYIYHVYDKEPKTPGTLEAHQPNDRMEIGWQSQSRLNRQPMGWSLTRRPDGGRTGVRPLDPLPGAPLNPLPRHRPQLAEHLNSRGQNSSPFFTRIRGCGKSGLKPGSGLSANARVGTMSIREHAPTSTHQKDWDRPRSLNNLSRIDMLHNRRQNEPLPQRSHTGAHRNSNFNSSFIQHNAQHVNQCFIKRPEEHRLSSSYFNSMPPPQMTIPMPRSYHTPRMPPISQFAPRPTSRRTFTRDDALNMVNPSRGHGTTSFYQNQADGMEIGILPNPVSMDARGLFSSAGGRRSVRR